MTRAATLDDEDQIRAETAEAAEDASGVAPLDTADVTRLVPIHVDVPAPTAAYRLRLAAVAAATIALPLVYLAIVAAVAGGVWWHATSNFALVLEKEMRGKTYAAPILIGLILLFFLLKPLLAPRVQAPEPCTVTPHDEPVLHAFVGSIARAVGAPEPVRIDVDLRVNASASFRRGWRSFGGGDLVLTIGTPLVEGMTIDELGGVLAHELGHFRQGWGMRASFAIWTVNAWFDRAVNGRDQWDERLRKAAGYAWALTIARGGIWLTRRVLWVLMTVGKRLDAALSRHMEIDADEHELALVGSATLATVMRKLVLLDAAHSNALDVMDEAWRDGRLPKNAPTLIRQCRARLDDEACAHALRSALDAETRSLSTHPCVNERVEHAARRAAPGAMHCTTPARALLSDPEALFERTTAWHYAEVVGLQVTPERLVAPTDLLGAQDAAQAATAARNRVTRDVIAYFLPLDPIGEDGLVGGVRGGDAAATIRAAIAALDEHATAARKALDRIDNADTRLAHVTRCRAVHDAGADPDDLKDLVITDRSPDALAAVVAEVRAAISGLRRPVDACHAALRERFAAARTLLSGPDAERFDELANAASAIARQHDALDTLRLDGYADTDLRRLIAEEEGKKRHEVRAALGSRAVQRLDALRVAWADIPHPYGMHGEPAPLADLAGEKTTDPGEALAIADWATDVAWKCHFRALAELCVLVEKAEAEISFDSDEGAAQDDDVTSGD